MSILSLSNPCIFFLQWTSAKRILILMYMVLYGWPDYHHLDLCDVGTLLYLKTIGLLPDIERA